MRDQIKSSRCPCGRCGVCLLFASRERFRERERARARRNYFPKRKPQTREELAMDRRAMES